MPQKPRLLRITTASISLKLLLRGQFTYFQQQGFEVLTVSADGSEVKEIIAYGVPHRVVPMTRKITPLQDLICLWKLIQVMREFKPDLVHTHTPKAGLLGIMAAWIVRVPARLHTVAGLPLMEARGVKRWVLKMTERITYACATNVFPNSKGLYEFIKKEFNVQPIKFKVIGAGSSNGIDTTYFSPTESLATEAKAIRQRYQIPTHAIIFSFVGRIVKDKGIVELIEAVKKLSSTTEVRLILVGPFEQELDPLPDQVMQFIDDSTHVIKAGFQQDVRPWLMASDAFVFPSYREGFPNVVMQAACLEVPCIVSDINGCNEIIRHQETGIIVPVKNTDALLEAMKFLAEHKDERYRFAKSSREFVVKNFDQGFLWSELLKEYRRVWKGSGR